MTSDLYSESEFIPFAKDKAGADADCWYYTVHWEWTRGPGGKALFRPMFIRDFSRPRDWPRARAEQVRDIVFGGGKYAQPEAAFLLRYTFKDVAQGRHGKPAVDVEHGRLVIKDGKKVWEYYKVPGGTGAVRSTYVPGNPDFEREYAAWQKHLGNVFSQCVTDLIKNRRFRCYGVDYELVGYQVVRVE